MQALLFMISLQAIVRSSLAKGTPTRFVTDKLPVYFGSSSVRQSRDGTFMPSVANGYVGTVIYSDTIHVSGVFNGKAYPKKHPVYPVYLYQHTHRARIPSTASVGFSIPGVSGDTSYALDVHEAVFYRWFKATNLSVEQRIYAHRTRKNLLVVELTANNTAGREFKLNIVPNLGYMTDDIHFYMTESYRSEALAATGLVSKNFLAYVYLERKTAREVIASQDETRRACYWRSWSYNQTYCFGNFRLISHQIIENAIVLTTTTKITNFHMALIVHLKAKNLDLRASFDKRPHDRRLYPALISVIISLLF